MRMLMPSHAKNVRPYRDPQPIFTRFGVESQLDAMFSPVVQLRSGGYIVINQTEALVAIDVNSGRATREHHIEDTALKTNLEAAEEVARQLRLRDLAGLIVIDFIDMDEKRNNRAVERKLKECLKHDRARIQVGRISHFGLLEMSRQRIRTGVLESSTEKCPHCGGTGHMRSVASVTLQLLRSLEEALLKGATHNMIVRTRSDIALYVLNHKRAHLRDLEQRFRIAITINADASINGAQAFVVERGDQVHTLEAARAIAAQPSAFLPGPDEVEEDEENLELTAEEAEDSEAEGEGEAEAEPGESAEGGVRKRRRRRRRGRRDEADEQADATQLAPAAPAARDATETDETEEGEEAEAEERAGAEAEPGDGERQRRRRGRRGGRRNRREEGEEHWPTDVSATPASEGWREWTEAPQPGDAGLAPASPETPTDVSPASRAAAPEPAAWEPAPAASVTRLPEAPQLETPEPETAKVEAPKVEAPKVEAPRAEEPPPRRRSTVREPAPFLVAQDQAAAADALPTPPTAPEPVSAPEPVILAEPADAGPRKSGWWSKKIFGKG
jgi:ribonuclease E